MKAPQKKLTAGLGFGIGSVGEHAGRIMDERAKITLTYEVHRLAGEKNRRPTAPRKRLVICFHPAKKDASDHAKPPAASAN